MELAACMRVLELEPMDPEPEPEPVVGIPAKVDEDNVAKRGEVGEISGESC